MTNKNGHYTAESVEFGTDALPTKNEIVKMSAICVKPYAALTCMYVLNLKFKSLKSLSRIFSSPG